MDKTKIILNILKENIIYVLPIFIVLIIFVNFVIPQSGKSLKSFERANKSKEQYEQVKEQFEALKAQQEFPPGRIFPLLQRQALHGCE